MAIVGSGCGAEDPAAIPEPRSLVQTIPHEGRQLSRLTSESAVSPPMSPGATPLTDSPATPQFSSGTTPYSQSAVAAWLVEPARGNPGSRLSGIQNAKESPSPVLTIGARVACTGIAFAPDGKRLVVASTTYDGPSTSVWDVTTGQLVAEGSGGWTFGAAYHPLGQTVASAGNGVRVLDANSGMEILKFSGHTVRVCSVAFSTDGTQILSASQDSPELRADSSGKLITVGEAKIWDTRDGHELLTIPYPAFCARFNPDGEHVTTSGRDGIRVWDRQTGELMLAFGDENTTGMALSADGKRIAAVTYGGAVTVWDASTGKELTTYRDETDELTCVAFSPDGKLLAYGTGNLNKATDKLKAVHIVDVMSEKELFHLDAHVLSVTAIDFSPDSSYLATGGFEIKIWKIRDLVSTELGASVGSEAR